jgi:hypothetical protein
MTKPIVTARTAIGTFTRRTYNAYTHIIVDTGSGQALRWSGNVNASDTKNAQVAADGVRYFKRLLGAENYLDIVAFPIVAEAPAAIDVPLPADAEPTVIVPNGDVLTREEARAMVGHITVRQLSKSLVHDIKADRKDDTMARTFCGVPINGAAQHWLVSMNSVSCPTCQKAAVKAA